MTSVTRYHDFCMGHRVVGHEGKCRFLHGHNYRAHFTLIPRADQLDKLGRVIDFGVIKELICQWIEDNWDHKTLLWDEDPLLKLIANLRSRSTAPDLTYSFIFVPFNPTAENIARHLVEIICPNLLRGKPVMVKSVKLEETRKCSATYSK